MIRFVELASGVILAIGLCFAQTDDARHKIWGKWTTEQQGSSSDAGVWVIEQDKEGLRLQYPVADHKKSDLTCNTVGQECKTKIDGKDSTVSFYFNGSRLVEWEKSDGKVFKRRFQASDDGKTLEIETTSVVPSGSPETIRLIRVEDHSSVAAK